MACTAAGALALQTFGRSKVLRAGLAGMQTAAAMLALQAFGKSRAGHAEYAYSQHHEKVGMHAYLWEKARR
jgi:hypothetical protein